MKINSNKILKYIFLTLLLCFIVIYFSEITGYYEYQNYQKSRLTEEQIKKFEAAIKNGEVIDLESFIVKESISYDNKLSKLASRLSDNISYIVKFGMEKTFIYISKLVEE